MPISVDRFGAADPVIHGGWTSRYVIPPSRLFGANGIRAGADGRIYVAQLAGSRVSAINPDTFEIEHLDTTGGEITGPDDLAFDDSGNMFVTEFTAGRVSMRAPSGKTHILRDDIPGSNPISWHQGRLLVGECRMDARIMELDRNGGAPRIILEHVPMANAFEVGPDGKLYFPVMGTNEIWRVNLDGSECEVVAGDLGVPDSVKFDSKGRIVSTQVGSGQVIRLDIQSGTREVLADIGPGLDNCAFIGDRLFVSHTAGSIHEILEPGKLRALSEKGLLWPMGLAVAPDGSLLVVDGSYAYLRPPHGEVSMAGMLGAPGFPGAHRGAAAAGGGAWYVTTSFGEVRRWNPVQQENELLADGCDLLMDIAADPRGRLVFADYGSGRVLSLENGEVSVLASGLDKPSGIAIGADGTVYATESGAGRVVKLGNGSAEVVADGLKLPEGIAARGDKLYVIDVAARELVQFGTDGTGRETIVSGLPVGTPTVPRKYLGPVGDMSGPMLSFAGIAIGLDGEIYVGADGNGSVIALYQPGAGSSH